MRSQHIAAGLSVALLGACASMGDSSMSPEQLTECLQPNRRVVVEVTGVAPKPAPKPPAGQEAKPETKPDAKPEAKPATVPANIQALAQGNSAFDPGSATLKEGGRQELDQMIANIAKRNIRANAIIVTGHTDRLEAARGPKELSEARARAVADYLASKGIDRKLMFWEGKEAREPVAVTKFCT